MGVHVATCVRMLWTFNTCQGASTGMLPAVFPRKAMHLYFGGSKPFKGQDWQQDQAVMLTNMILWSSEVPQFAWQTPCLEDEVSLNSSLSSCASQLHWELAIEMLDFRRPDFAWAPFAASKKTRCLFGRYETHSSETICLALVVPSTLPGWLRRNQLCRRKRLWRCSSSRCLTSLFRALNFFQHP